MKTHLWHGLLAFVSAVIVTGLFLGVSLATRLIIAGEAYLDVTAGLLVLALIQFYVVWLFQDGAAPDAARLLIAWVRLWPALFRRPQGWRQLGPDEIIDPADECCSWSVVKARGGEKCFQEPSLSWGWIPVKGFEHRPVRELHMAVRRRISS